MRSGAGRFLVFYLLCGVAGGAAHALAAPLSNVPLVGASGAIAGVIAAYMMIRPCARITVLIFGFIPISLASYWVLGFWALSQVWHVFSLDKSDTAWWAHVGGLAAGALLIVVMRPPGVAAVPVLQPGGRDCACGIKVFGSLGSAAMSLCCTALTAHGVSHRLPAARGGSFPA